MKKDKSLDIIVKRKKIHSIICDKAIKSKGRISLGFYPDYSEFLINIKNKNSYESQILNSNNLFCKCCKKQLFIDYPFLKKLDI